MQKCASGGQYQYFPKKTMKRNSTIALTYNMFDLHQSQGVGDCVEQGGTGHGCPHNKVLAHVFYISVVYPVDYIIDDGKAASFMRTLSLTPTPI